MRAVIPPFAIWPTLVGINLVAILGNNPLVLDVDLVLPTILMEEDTPSCVPWKNTTIAMRMHGMMKDRVRGLHVVRLLEDNFRLWSLVAPLVFIIISSMDGRVQAVEESFVFVFLSCEPDGL